jgi:hypothetical protein
MAGLRLGPLTLRAVSWVADQHHEHEWLCHREVNSGARACGKQWGVDHNWCGRWEESTQGFAEMMGAGRYAWPLVQRRRGVGVRIRASKNKKSTKILLTENGGRTILPLRQ